MLKKSLFLILFFVFVCSGAWAWTLTSDPSPVDVTQWKVTLDNGTVYKGEVVDNKLFWDITELEPGNYQGEACFGLDEWELDAEGDKKYYGTTWGPSTPFVLKRNELPNEPTNLNAEQ